MVKKRFEGNIIQKKHQYIKNRGILLSDVCEKKILNARKIVLDIFEKGIEAANPKKAVKEFLTIKDDKLILSDFSKVNLKKDCRIVVVGAGKASASMALTVESLLGENISQGLICVPEEEIKKKYPLKKIILHPAGHPYVNDGSVDGAKRILELVENLTENDIVLALISGGGSALVELPLETITLTDLHVMFNLLTNVGASIHELNSIRKHLSKIKGGKLAEAAQPAKVISLIISDVVGDDLDTIASGPTAPDNTTWEDVEEILQRYNLKGKIPVSIAQVIEKGINNEIEDTPKKTKPFFKKVSNFIIASNTISCNAMKKAALDIGLDCNILSTEINGEAKEVGSKIASAINDMENNTLLIASGETTVKIIGEGQGGRNQELVLSAGIQLKKSEIILASIGSDGKDGPTDAAGALVDKCIINAAKRGNLDLQKYLTNNDSYNFFKKTNGLIITGLTGTNVMDLIIALKMNE
ncbi:MAG: glycerate kinase type-2 family protein [Candidatus Heimdallarchaeota archaeon]